jgi:hypothetical protein
MISAIKTAATTSEVREPEQRELNVDELKSVSGGRITNRRVDMSGVAIPLVT